MAKIYTTSEGDTFDMLALSFYGAENKASVLIQANPDLGGVLIFDEGMRLTIPDAAPTTSPTTLPPWRRDG